VLRCFGAGYTPRRPWAPAVGGRRAALPQRRRHPPGAALSALVTRGGNQPDAPGLHREDRAAKGDQVRRDIRRPGESRGRHRRPDFRSRRARRVEPFLSAKRVAPGFPRADGLWRGTSGVPWWHESSARDPPLLTRLAMGRRVPSAEARPRSLASGWRPHRSQVRWTRVKPPRCWRLTVSGTPAPAWRLSISNTASLGSP
jgi:hypothetical protein